MKEIYEALGWQGGTIHLIIDEIKRLKENEKALNDILPLLPICEPITGHKIAEELYAVENNRCKDMCKSFKICNILSICGIR